MSGRRQQLRGLDRARADLAHAAPAVSITRFVKRPPAPSPVAAVRHVLHDRREDLLSRRRQAGIGHAGHGDLQHRRLGELAVLGVIEGALDVFQRGREQQPPAQRGLIHAGEPRQPIQGQVQFRREPARAQMRDATDETRIQVLGPQQPQKGRLGIGAGNHAASRVQARRTARTTPAARSSSYQDPLDRRVGPDHHPGIDGRLRQGIRQPRRALRRARPASRRRQPAAAIRYKKREYRPG